MRLFVLAPLCLILAGCAGPSERPDAGDAGPGPHALLRLELFYDDAALAEARSFYVDVVGMELDPASSDGFVILRLGAAQLDLNRVADLPADHYFRSEIATSRRGLGTEIVIEVDDVEALYADVASTDYPIESTLRRRSWGQTDFRIADPGGYYVRFTSP